MAVLAVSVVSLVSLSGVVGLFLNSQLFRKIIFVLVSLSAGALLGDAFIHILPEVLANTGATAGVVTFLGIISFFVLEKFLHWRHSHGDDDNEREGVDTFTGDRGRKHLGVLIFVADGLHNLLDGLIIAASFFVSDSLGLATTLAVVLHEIPQEIGDFALLIHAGWDRFRALVFNFLSALLAFLGILLFYLIGERVNDFTNLALAFAGGGFIYIAGVDLLPEMHHTKDIKKSIAQFVAFLSGAALMYVLLFLE
jgi:zinc and cadmium transporter